MKDIKAIAEELVSLCENAGIEFSNSTDQHDKGVILFPDGVRQKRMPTHSEAVAYLVETHPPQYSGATILQRLVTLFSGKHIFFNAQSGEVRAEGVQYYVKFRFFATSGTYGHDRDEYNERTDYDSK